MPFIYKNPESCHVSCLKHKKISKKTFDLNLIDLPNREFTPRRKMSFPISF